MIWTKHLPEEERYAIFFNQIKDFAEKNSISFEQMEKAFNIGLSVCQQTGYIETRKNNPVFIIDSKLLADSVYPFMKHKLSKSHHLELPPEELQKLYSQESDSDTAD